MAAFCNQFDRVATELGCAVIYCHHHSKGSQGQKRSMDRASGSGVFARDPDALLDMIELEIPDSVYTQEENKAAAALCCGALQYYLPMRWQELYSQDDACSEARMMEICRLNLTDGPMQDLLAQIAAQKRAVRARTAWRIEGTLREFPKFPPVNLWFDFPRHRPDDSGALGDLSAEDSKPPLYPRGNRGSRGNAGKAEDPYDKKMQALESAFSFCAENGEVRVKTLAAHMKASVNTVKAYVDSSDQFERDKKGIIKRVNSEKLIG
jgi:RecA-family ATPase